MSWLKAFRAFLLLVGLACLGYFAYTLADQTVYQAYANWAFDQQIAGRAPVTFRDYLLERTPLALLVRTKQARPHVSHSATLVEGSILGRLTIPRLDLSAIVQQGVSENTLSQAVGHVSVSALPGQAGNFALAAHRDTLFRKLKDIQKGDLVTFQSVTGLFTYQVMGTRIVRPTDVTVLQPDGGLPELRPNAKILTMITCYPFHYVGSAPRRFIVQAEVIAAK